MSLIEKIAAFIVTLAILYGFHYALEKKAVRKEHDAVVAMYEKQVADGQLAVQKAQSQLVFQKTQADLEKQGELKTLDSKYGSLVSSLRTRATRAEARKTGSGAIAQTSGACTGTGLYRDDAEFLAGYARQAASVKLERDYYYGRYEAARLLLSGQVEDDRLNGSVSDTKPIP